MNGRTIMRVGADYVGADEETLALLGVGADYVGADYVGAHHHGKRLKPMHLAMARNMPAIFLGFDQNTIAASSSASVTSEGNVALRPTDLVVRASNAADFQFTQITIGRTNLLAGATGIPAEAFNTSVVRPPISAPVLEAGTLATLGTTNLTAGASRFMAMFTCLDLSKHPSSP